MSDNNFSRFLIAGTSSGSGKTTLTLGILRALARRGLRVAPFKCGPDYIDPLFHRQAAGRMSVNLDVFFGSHGSFTHYAQNSDVAVAEGVMGLFDGTAAGELAGSCAEIAALLHLPVILTVNARGLSNSIAPLVQGFSSWNRRVKIVGVIANNVGSERHAELLRNALSAAHLPPLVGYLLRDERWTLPERHLGLSLGTLSGEWMDALADEVETHVDLTQILSLTSAPAPRSALRKASPPKFRLGVAMDEAFCFYYEENFDLLRRNGVEIAVFSPLSDSVLPEHLDGLYFGGGYPELYAERLAGNRSMRDAVRKFSEEHFVYGECGGYLYLMEAVCDLEENRFEMLNLLPGVAKMNRKLTALGYRSVCGRWGTLRGHEFHYSCVSGAETDSPLWVAEDLHGNTFPAGGVCGRVMGSYIHLHFGSSPSALAKFIKELEA